MNKYHWQGFLVAVLLTSLALLGNHLATINNESDRLLSQSEQVWQGALDARQESKEKVCRRVIANYAHGVGGSIYSVETAERLYQLCIQKVPSR